MAFSETARVREFQRYFFALRSANSHHSPDVLSSHDTALTAFAQLGALRLNVRRCIITLFGIDTVYVIAEATKTLSLRNDDTHDSDDQLLLGISSVPRSLSPCALTVDVASYDSYVHIEDLSQDARFEDSPYRRRRPSAKFFAANPITSPNGAIIGSYAVMDDNTHPHLDNVQTEFMKDMASTVGQHLVARRAQEEHRQGEKGVRGMGSFAEGLTSIRNWRAGPELGERYFEESRRHLGGEGQLDRRQQDVQHDADKDIAFKSPMLADDGSDSARYSTSSRPANIHSTPPTSPARQEEQPETLQESMLAPGVKTAFSRAANLLRESMEVHGVMFLDASVGSYGGLVDEEQQDQANVTAASSQSSTDEDPEAVQSSDHSLSDTDPHHRREKMSGLLGFATSDHSSINQHAPSKDIPMVSERILQTLLLRYPKGKIFRLTDDALIASSSSDDKDIPPITGVPARRHDAPNEGGRRKRSKLPKEEAKFLFDMFKGSRSLLFVPIWDFHRSRWFSGCFVWSARENRVFTTEGDLSYLAVFGSIIMAEVARLDASKADEAKSGLLSSISHELRSPLHGILACVEMLGEGKATAFQSDMYQTIGSCGTTLLDIIDHLLDYTKINHSMEKSNKQRQSRLSTNSQVSPVFYSDGFITHLDLTTEEIINVSVVGYDAQTHSHVNFNQQDMQDSQLKTSFALDGTDDTILVLDIDKSIDRGFPIRTGAWRQILMNLFTNSLKYTDRGYIKISLNLQQPTKRARSKLVLTVTDSGRGMSQEFIQGRLFTPFSQENHLTPGAGLGLSILKGIVSSCRGTIDVQSTKGEGSRISVAIPVKQQDILKEPTRSTEHLELDKTAQSCNGLIYTTLGLDTPSYGTVPGQTDSSIDPSKASVRVLKHALDKMCHAWFGLRESANLGQDSTMPSIYFAVETPWNSSEIRSGDLFTSIPRLSRRALDEGGSNPILLILCKSAESARALPAQIRNGAMSGVIVEYISQPCGPHKLSRALFSCLNRRETSTAGNSSSHSQQEEQPQSHGTLASETKTQTSSPLESLADKLQVTVNSSGPVATPASLPLQQLATSSLESFAPFLIVDDNLVNLRVLGMYLSKRHIEHYTAMDGKQAFQFFRENHAKCRTIIMDIQMPILDGLESVRLMRAFEKEQGIGATPSQNWNKQESYNPELSLESNESTTKRTEKALIVMLTGLGNASIRAETFASGADGFWLKPLVLGKMEAGLKELVQSHHSESKAEETILKGEQDFTAGEEIFGS